MADFGSPGTPSRHEKSLGLLTTKFVSLLQEAKDGVLDLKVVSISKNPGFPTRESSDFRIRLAFLCAHIAFSIHLLKCLPLSILGGRYSSCATKAANLRHYKCS